MSSTLPAPPPSIPTTTPTWTRLQSPFQLLPGRTYAAVLSLSSFERAFANSTNIAEKLENAGFADVSVMMTIADTTDDLIALAPTEKGPWAIGVWNLVASSAQLPSQVKAVWMQG